MVSANANLPGASQHRTLWGLDPLQLHTRYWASHGVQVVRQGEPSQIVNHAELYLLTDPRSLPLFKLSHVIDELNWIKPQVLFIRLHDLRERGYRERVVTEEHDRFVRFQRMYDSADRLARVVLTPEREIAQLWQKSPDPLAGWRRMRRFIPRSERMTLSIDGTVYDRSTDDDIAAFLHDLVRDWGRPDATIARARLAGKTSGGNGHARVWIDPESKIDENARLIGSIWIGAGRSISPGATVVGPTIVWDDPESRPETDNIQWLQIEPSQPTHDPQIRPLPTGALALKRAFDIVFSAIALLLTAPLYPIIMIAIWLEDGRPWFFVHRRETLNGREFGCIKFRSMRKDAEEIKKRLILENQADGPQFFMENDPRLTRVGRILRKFNLDELPQFWNVLVGDMSIVGPRPSPHHENQYCPEWREARLSVRPGITGLWQISRTRRSGNDFQEWIRYDIEYVENYSPWLDLKIIWKTIEMIVRKGLR